MAWMTKHKKWLRVHIRPRHTVGLESNEGRRTAQFKLLSVKLELGPLKFQRVHAVSLGTF